MFKRITLLCLLAVGAAGAASAQGYTDSYQQQGEIGIGLGAAHYFGDLNTNASLKRPKFSGGLFFRKALSNYIGIKVAFNYAKLGYSDRLSDNEAQRIRNLSFNTDIYEGTISGEFNFFRFYPGLPGSNFTPYVSLGAGIFNYNPYAYLNNQKYSLRELGTEGQGSNVPGYENRKPYGSIAMCIPLAFGFKYAISENWNVFTEVGYRFTTTDYIDDVSTTYAPDAFPALPTGEQSVAFQLQDRSGAVTATPIGIKGRQRGNSTQKDAYVIWHVGLSFNLSSYRCPSPSGYR
jgi:hypothetical protein